MGTRTSFSLKSAVPIALIILVASILSAMAGQDVTVKVPFDFQAGGTHFPPGAYTLSMDNAMPGSVVIKSADGHRGIAFARKTISASVKSAPVVSFRTSSESRYLLAIQGESAAERWELVPTARETSLARASTQPMVANLSASSSGSGQ